MLSLEDTQQLFEKSLEHILPEGYTFEKGKGRSYTVYHNKSISAVLIPHFLDDEKPSLTINVKRMRFRNSRYLSTRIGTWFEREFNGAIEYR